MSFDEHFVPSIEKKRYFATTRWSLVAAARGVDSVEARQALEALCAAYWYPLYAFVRRSGYSVSDAEDLTQAFFGRFLEKNDVAAAVRDRGKFRSFLLAAMKHFLANERDRARAQKRGGGRLPVSLDFKSGESRYQIEPSHELTADKLFDQQWAVALLDRVLIALRQEYADGGNEELFDQLKTCLVATSERLTSGELATHCGMTEGAVKVAVHRLRRRYRQCLRQEIEQTVASPQDVEEEIRELFGAFRR